MALTANERQVVRGIAQKMGVPLKGIPTEGDAHNLLRMATEHATARIATARTKDEHNAWWLASVSGRQALKGHN